MVRSPEEVITIFLSLGMSRTSLSVGAVFSALSDLASMIFVVVVWDVCPVTSGRFSGCVPEIPRKRNKATTAEVALINIACKKSNIVCETDEYSIPHNRAIFLLMSCIL